MSENLQNASENLQSALDGYEPTPSGQLSERIARRALRRKWRARLSVAMALVVLSAITAVGVAVALPGRGISADDIRHLIRDVDVRLDQTARASDHFAEVASGLCERASDRSRAVVKLTALIPSVTHRSQARELSDRLRSAVRESRHSVARCAAAGQRLDEMRSQVRELQDQRKRLLRLLDADDAG